MLLSCCGPCSRRAVLLSLVFILYGFFLVNIGHAANTATLAGSSPGHFKVSQTGSARYSIPLALPAGSGGHKPSFSLEYDSQAGNGLYGHGWSLSGMSSIRRCGKTQAIDGEVSSITWDDRDRLCLDGQRLIVDAGSYGAVGSQYRLLMDDGSRVRIASYPNGSRYFVRLMKDGRVIYYGNVDSRQPGLNGQVYVWWQEVVRDPRGNHISYEYTNDGLGFRLLEVNYAYGGGEQPHARVAFVYNDRPDWLRAYVAGVDYVQKQRVTRIDVESFHGGDWHVVSSYRLGYDNVGVEEAPSSRLISAQQCADWSGTDCLPAHEFRWQGQWALHNSETSLEQELTDSNLGWRSPYKKVFMHKPFDVDGDGRQELLFLMVKERKHARGTDWQIDLRYLGTTNGTGGLKESHFGNGLPYSELYQISQSRRADSSINVNDIITNLHVIDYNSDGREDVVYYDDKDKEWELFLSVQHDGDWRLSAHPSSPLPGLSNPNTLFLDMTGDGLVDAFAANTIYPLTRNTSSADKSLPYHFDMEGEQVSWSGDINFNHKNLQDLGDVNGDGVMDLVVAAANEGNDRHFYILERDGENFVEVEHFQTNESTKKVRLTDINGDGLADAVFEALQDNHHSFSFSVNTGQGFTNERVLKSVHYEISQGERKYSDQTYGWRYQDITGDGVKDFIWFDSTGNLRYRAYDIRNQSFGEEKLVDIKGGISEQVIFADFNGDSRSDYATYNHETGFNAYKTITPIFSQGVYTKNNTIHYLSNGAGSDVELSYYPVRFPYHYAADVELSDSYERQLCRGSNEQVCATLGNDAYHDAFRAALVGNWDLPWDAVELSDGMVGYAQSAVLPLRGGLSVVTSSSHAAPRALSTPGNVQNLRNIKHYRYGGGRLQGGGRGFLGFQYVTRYDGATGFVNKTAYRQDFPFIGRPLHSITYSSWDHTAPLEQTHHKWDMQVNSGAEGLPYFRVWEGESQVLTHHTASTIYGFTAETDIIKDQVTSRTVDNWGNITEERVKTKGPHGTWYERVMTAYYDPGYDGDFPYWGLVSRSSLGRVLQHSVTYSRSEAEDEDRYEQTSYAYYEEGEQTGLLKQAIAMSHTGVGVTTHYGYDGFGNVNLQYQTGITGIVWGERHRTSHHYDGLGRYVVKRFNHYGQQEEHVLNRDKFGNPVTVEAISGLRTNYTYDVLGREEHRSDSTGAWQATHYFACDSVSHCPEGGVYGVLTQVSGGHQSLDYRDDLDRRVRQLSTGFDGRWIHQDTEYDAQGRVVHESSPYYAGEAIQWTRIEYDRVGRPVKVISPDNSEVWQSHGFGGLTRVTRDALGRTQTEYYNVMNEVTVVVDAMGGKVEHHFDGKGHPIRIVSYDTVDGEPQSEIVITYDALGNKSTLKDPNIGKWYYGYDSFGALVWQRDGNNQTTVFNHDGLGRLISRADPNSGLGSTTTYWTYDNTPTPNPTAGQLLNSEIHRANGHVEQRTTYTHDDLGRPLDRHLMLSLPEWNLAGNYNLGGVRYDGLGRVGSTRDALSNLGTESGTRLVYNTAGYVDQVRDLDTDDLLWETDNQNARGQVTHKTYGNGSRTAYSYHSATGRLERIRTYNKWTYENLQWHDYGWDEVGNLEWRQRSATTFGYPVALQQETFCYDALNRLVSTIADVSNGQECRNAAQDTHYNGLGNITWTAADGDYHYDAQMNGSAGDDAGLHAVTRVGSKRFYYDNNGNLVDEQVHNASQRYFRYTSFNQVSEMGGASHKAYFTYGVDREQVLRVDQSGGGLRLKLYLGNVELSLDTREADRMTWTRHLDDEVIHTVVTNGQLETIPNTETYVYVHKDHLGSLDVMTDGEGYPLYEDEQMSFTAWGARRASADWVPYDAGPFMLFEDAFAGDRGYTGHEHVDEIGIIHMKGRIYDPYLKRFLQPDPIVQAPDDLQMYNRYSYVRNNPLNATDPSGYTAEFNFDHEVTFDFGVDVDQFTDVDHIDLNSYFPQLSGIEPIYFPTVVDSINSGVSRHAFSSSWTLSDAIQSVVDSIDYHNLHDSGGILQPSALGLFGFELDLDRVLPAKGLASKLFKKVLKNDVNAFAGMAFVDPIGSSVQFHIGFTKAAQGGSPLKGYFQPLYGNSFGPSGVGPTMKLIQTTVFSSGGDMTYVVANLIADPTKGWVANAYIGSTGLPEKFEYKGRPLRGSWSKGYEGGQIATEPSKSASMFPGVTYPSINIPESVINYLMHE